MIKATKVKDMTFFQRDNNSYQSKVTINGRRKTFYGKTKNEIRQKYQQYLREVENDEEKLNGDKVVDKFVGIMTVDKLREWIK